MKKIILSTALCTMALPGMVSAKMGYEDYILQAQLQMAEAAEFKTKSRGAIATVGDDVSCDFRLGTTRIQDAIDSGATDIRVASSTYTENLVIDSRSVDISGGYADCTEAANGNDNGNRQIIRGVNGSGGPTITITGDTERYTVNLTRLTIEDGEAGFIVGGGVSTQTADVALTLNDVGLSGNVGSLGGGLSVFGGNTDVTMLNTLVVANEAIGGGGIFCSGSDNSIFIDDDGNGASGVFFNQATAGDGGGAQIIDGCVFNSFSGRPEDFGFLDTRGFVSNTATGNGGGIAVVGGASATFNGGLFCFFGCLGDNTRPANIDFNTADEDGDGSGLGGGIYASGSGTTITLFNAVVKDNGAQAGGGIAIENEAVLNMQSLYVFNTCWKEGSCSQLNNNITAQSGFPARGGGLYATTGADVNIATTTMTGNRANFGTALYAFAEDTDPVTTNMDVEGSLIVNNGDDTNTDWFDDDTVTIRGAVALLDYNTIADNDVGGGANIFNTDSGTVEIFSSIIHNTDGALVYRGDVQAGGTLPYECLMVNEAGSLPAEPEVVVDDPEFVDRANGDFHLDAAISPAIDFCTTLNASTPDFFDADNDERGFDDPIATNFQGPFDVGYDETYDNDIIFADNFDD